MTARDDRVDARVVRVGPRLPPGARVRVRSMRDDDASKISLATRDDDDDDATRDDASAPRADDVVTIAHYGWRARRVEDDAIVRDETSRDAARPREVLTFRVDDAAPVNFVPCAGVEAAVTTMRVGERVGIVVPSGGAPFASEPFSPAPRNVYVEWEVELLSVTREEKPSVDASVEEVLRYCERKKEEANALFARGEEENGYARALRRYEDAATALRRTIMSTARAGAKDALALAVKCHVNSATCLSKLQRHSEAILHAEAALDLDATAVKAMYRKAMALEQQGRDEEALTALRDALELSKDRTIREAFVRVRRRMNAVHEGEREVCARMVQTDPTTEPTTRGFGERAAQLYRKRPALAGAITVAAFAAMVMYFRRSEKSASTTTATSD